MQHIKHLLGHRGGLDVVDELLHVQLLILRAVQQRLLVLFLLENHDGALLVAVCEQRARHGGLATDDRLEALAVLPQLVALPLQLKHRAVFVGDFVAVAARGGRLGGLGAAAAHACEALYNEGNAISHKQERG